MRLLFGVAGLLSAQAVVGQYFPPTPENVTTVRSRFNNNITISYKEVRSNSSRLLCVCVELCALARHL